MTDNKTYEGTGVNYRVMDPFKRECQAAGLETRDALARWGFQELTWSRGESCYLIETPWCYLAALVEGLGTKNIVADAMADQMVARAIAQQMEEYQRYSYNDRIAHCSLAMMYNDLITSGALPLTTFMHLAVGSSNWFKDETRSHELIEGWKAGCLEAGSTWGGGETPNLRDIVLPGASVISGAVLGIIMPKHNLIRPNIRVSDRIIVIFSSGIHANGLTLARDTAADLPDSYLTKLPSGRYYGEALLDPTVFYVKLIDQLQQAGVPIHYAINVTGHGWRKIMRAEAQFDYVVEKIPPVPEVLQFMVEKGPVSLREAYGNLNMGAGFALIVPPEDADRVIQIAQQNGYQAMDVGYVEAQAGDDKRLQILPIGETFFGKELEVR